MRETPVSYPALVVQSPKSTWRSAVPAQCRITPLKRSGLNPDGSGWVAHGSDHVLRSTSPSPLVSLPPQNGPCHTVGALLARTQAQPCVW